MVRFRIKEQKKLDQECNNYILRVALLLAADIETIICNGSKLRFLFDNAKECEKIKRIVKIDGPVTEEEKKEADSFGITILNILEVEVSN